MSEKRSLSADLKRAMNGLASAHLGDYLSDPAKRASLGIREPVRLSVSLPRGVRAEGSPRRVALAMQGRVEPKALRYARNACERMDADLDLLTDIAESGLKRAIEPQVRDLAQAGHRLEIVRLRRDVLGGILEYALSRRGLLFVVISAQDLVAERVMSQATDERHLAVPWVVVTG